MFNKDRNPGFEELSDHAKGLVLTWMKSYEAKLQDPYPQRRQKQIEVAAKVERTKAQYPGLTKYSYHAEKGFQESKAPGWLPSMSIPAVPAMPAVPAVPKPGYPSLPSYSYPSMPTYEGVTSYLPSIPYWSRKPEPAATDEMQSDIKTETETKDAPDAEQNKNDEKKPETQVTEAANQPLPEDEQQLPGDDQNLLGMLRRTGSIPGVTEDLFFQRTDEPYETQAEVDASRDESLGASMAEEIPTEPGQVEAKASELDTVEPQASQGEAPDTQADADQTAAKASPETQDAQKTSAQVPNAGRSAETEATDPARSY